MTAARDGTRSILSFCVLALAPLGAGCNSGPPSIAAPAVPAVPVSQPVERQVTDYVDFTGRTDAIQAVNVVPRATGYVAQIAFEEGTDVKTGQLLFQIDPKPYEAQVHLGEANVANNRVQLQLAKQNYERALTLQKKDAISGQEFDQYAAARDQAAAQLQAAQANLDIYRLNLQYTRVTSPIDGQVSRTFFTLGNLVAQDQTLLTTIVSLDPIYAYFDVDQRTLLNIRRAINEGKIRSRRASPSRPGFDQAKIVAAQGLLAPDQPVSVLGAVGLAAVYGSIGPAVIPVFLGMPGETGYPHQGYIDFANNQLNPTTGSISARGIFANPRPTVGVRLMSPGMFVRIRLPIGPPHPALLIIDRAIQTEQGQKFVYVIGTDNKLEYRQVVTGALQEDGLRVISGGLSATDSVVVGALQQIRPNMQVTTQPVPMPSFKVTVPGA